MTYYLALYTMIGLFIYVVIEHKSEDKYALTFFAVSWPFLLLIGIIIVISLIILNILGFLKIEGK